VGGQSVRNISVRRVEDVKDLCRCVVCIFVFCFHGVREKKKRATTTTLELTVARSENQLGSPALFL
jgi:protein gp37